MSFQTGLSGLNAASRNLDVIGNNIANANTTGMKASRTEFAGLVASSLGAGGSGNGAGIGVETAAISQQFSQGNINITGNNLDVAINGGGFFQLTLPDGSRAYTRDGSFKLDKDGNIKSNGAASLMGYPTDTAGVVTSSTIQPLKVPTNAPIPAKATNTIVAEFNLDARAKVAAGAVATAGPPATAAIPATPRSTFGTALNIYDSQGVASPINLYFEKDTAANTWKIYSGIDTPAVTGPPAVAAVTYPSLGTLVFDSAGKLTTGTPTISTAGTNSGKFGITIASPTAFASVNPNDTDKKFDGPLDIVLEGATQFGAAFSVSDLTQNGYTSGELIGLNIDASGKIVSRYSNGETQTNGQLALAEFRNAQGLVPAAGNNWTETFASGQPVQGSPGQGKFGSLRAGALEESNVDLTAELVNMMTAQRAYQANAQTIKTQDQVMSTLVNLK
jgi:flagellar hook protein FlgE